MKKFKLKLMAILATIGLAFGVAFTPITASAETMTETPETSAELPEETDGTSTGDTTFEDFLTWAEKEADKYGYGDDFRGAIETIKAAASEKQVTISTIASFCFAVGVIALLIYIKIKDKKFKKTVTGLCEKLDEKLDDQIKGTNALIDGENEIIHDETANAKTLQETQKEVCAIKKAFSSFVSAFLRFTDGVKLGDNKKAEVQTNCINALKEIGEVHANENNEV
jgi:uncharacterized protein YoxC